MCARFDISTTGGFSTPSIWSRFPLLVPAYNESATIVDSVRNLISLDFPEYEVIVINDGSKDDTLQLLIDAYELLPFRQP
jgi:cellulose synthase/poly-beta-1,6-N-acetylglucosamine synthase-like glycosyltransferase